MNFKHFALLPMLTVGIIFCFSCTKEKKAVHVESVTLDRDELELIEGERDTLKVTVLPAKAPQGVEVVASECGNYLNLTELVLPEGLVEFEGMYAFGNYKGTTLTLPSTLKRMSALTFGYGKMTTITVKAVTPPTITNYTRYGAFAHCESITAIYVPAESVERYKAATGWSFHKDIIQAIPSE